MLLWLLWCVNTGVFRVFVLLCGCCGVLGSCWGVDMVFRVFYVLL